MQQGCARDLLSRDRDRDVAAAETVAETYSENN